MRFKSSIHGRLTNNYQLSSGYMHLHTSLWATLQRARTEECESDCASICRPGCAIMWAVKKHGNADPGKICEFLFSSFASCVDCAVFWYRWRRVNDDIFVRPLDNIYRCSIDPVISSIIVSDMYSIRVGVIFLPFKLRYSQDPS